MRTGRPRRAPGTGVLPPALCALVTLGAASSLSLAACRGGTRRDAAPGAAPAGPVAAAPSPPPARPRSPSNPPPEPPRSEARLVSDAPRAPVPAPATSEPIVVPPGSAPAGSAPGKSLDELLAVVEGEVLTRQQMVKLLGERAPEEGEAEYEQKLYRKLLERSRSAILRKAANRMGLTAAPDVVDQNVVRHAKRIVEAARAKAEEASPGSGASITFEKILAERGQTMDDFRAGVVDSMLIQNYFHVLTQGVPGKRAVLDFEACPADIRRLYDAHRERFDVQPGARFAMFRARPTDFYGQGGRSYDQAKEAAVGALRAALADFRAGAAPESLVQKHGIWKAETPPPGRWVDRDLAKRFGADMEAWLFDPARRVGDAQVFAVDDPVGLSVTEIRAGRTRTFEEVEAEIGKIVRAVRERRFELTHTLELLGRATVTSPKYPVLEDLQQMAREELKQIDENPVYRDIRLR